MDRGTPEEPSRKRASYSGSGEHQDQSQNEYSADASYEYNHSDVSNSPRKKIRRLDPGSETPSSAYGTSTDEERSPQKEYDQRRRFLVSPLVQEDRYQSHASEAPRSRLSLPDTRGLGEWRGSHKRSYSSMSEDTSRRNRYSDGGNQYNYQRKDVWIVGSSYVYWAHKRALVTTGKNLGFPDIRIFWKGKRGMRWHELISSEAVDSMQKFCGHSNPKVIFIYLSSNDVAYIKTEDLIESMTKDLQKIIQKYPSSKVVWCQLYPRMLWRESTVDIIEGEFVREVINETMSEVIKVLGGTTMTFPGITTARPEFYRDDGVHLNDLGNDEWLKTMKEHISTLEM